MKQPLITLKNPRTGSIKTAPVGFSWTVILFGFFVPLYRFDPLWSIIMFVVGSFTYGVGTILFAPFYNQLYIRSLVRKGYKLYSIEGHLTRHRADKIMGIKTPSTQSRPITLNSSDLLKEVAERSKLNNL